MPTRLDLPAEFDIGAAIEPALLTPSRRTDGWTPERQRNFCDLIACGHTVEGAARAQGLSGSSAYSFRNTANGAAFAIGWNAASLLQRQRLSDQVAARAFEGQTITVTRPDGSTVERHFYDNRLAMSVLARLDRLAAGQIAPGTPDTTGEGQAARLAAAEFDRYLDVLGGGDGGGGGPARAGLFLAARVADPASPAVPELAALSTLARADLYARTGAGVVAELPVADLDPAERAHWTAGQWTRAEAAGLLAVLPPAARDADGTSQDSQHSPAHDHVACEDEPVWWDALRDEYRTHLPVPAGQDAPDEEGEYGDDDYGRALTEEERTAVDAVAALEERERLAAHLAVRARWLAELRARLAAAGQGPADTPADAPRSDAPAPDHSGTVTPPTDADSQSAAITPISAALQSHIDGSRLCGSIPSFPAPQHRARRHSAACS